MANHTDESTSDICNTSALWRSIDKIIHFKVQGVLFGIPHSQLKESEFFAEMLGSDHIGKQDEGSMEYPIHLKRVTLSAVDSFLKVLQARTYKGAPKMSVNEWSDALRIATMWRFETLRSFTIKELNKKIKEPITRLELADSCEIREWFAPALARLCMRSDPFSVEEARRTGYDRVLHAWRVRDEMLKEGKWSKWEQPRVRRVGWNGNFICDKKLCQNCESARTEEETFCQSCGIKEAEKRLSSVE